MSSPGGRTARRHPRCVRKWRANAGAEPLSSPRMGATPNVRKIDTRDFRRATRSTPREINRQILLNLVREHQPISRADIARRMALGRGMVTILVNELLDEGALYEGALAELPRGRRPKMLHVETRDRLAVAIALRFSRTDVLLSDLGGRQIALERFATRFGPEELLDELAIRVHRLLRAHAAKRRCQGIGVVIPGMVDRAGGRVLNAPQLGWRDVQVRTGLAQRTGLPVQVENAPAACALAHIWLSERANGIRDFVYLSVSDGVGTGVVVNGEVVRGHAHTAGEFGHIPISTAGPHCLCGSQGCLEAHTSNLATVARYLGHELSPEIAEPAGRMPRLRGAIALVAAPVYAAPQVG